MKSIIRNVGWLAIVVATALGPSHCAVIGRPAIAEEQKPSVSLILAGASAEQLKQGILFACEAILDNASGKELPVRTNFYSAFDGLEVVVTNSEGKVLAQQGYTFHQSPNTGRTFALPPGSTKGSLVFPIHDLPTDSKLFKVRLVGALPGSDYRRILSSETIEVRPAAPNRP